MPAEDRSLPIATAPSERLQALLTEHGELMTGRELMRVFRYGSERAFRRAAIAGRLPVPAVRIEGRPGWFARTRDVAHWLDSLDGTPPPTTA